MKTNIACTYMAASLIVLLCSCAQKVTRPTADRYNLEITDNVEARRFDVSIESKDSRTLCISTESWPNSLGRFTVETDENFVQVGASRLPAKSKLMSTYCPGGCGELQIEPHGSLRGSISYDVFDDPEKLATEPLKRLIFPVAPYYCH